MISIEREQQHRGFHIFDEDSLDVVAVTSLEDVTLLLKACKEFLDDNYPQE